MYTATDAYVIVSRPRCSQMFFLYTGIMRAVFGEDPITFLRNTKLHDRNFVVFRDPHFTSYRAGLGGDGIDDLDSLAAFQADLLARMPHVTSHYHLGICAGAVPALHCGARLSASSVWAFALRITHPRDGSLFASGAVPDGEQGEKLFDFEFAKTLRMRIDEAPAGARFAAYYNVENAIDRRFAELLGQSRRVHLHALESPPDFQQSHNVVGLLRRRGELEEIFPRFVAA